MTKKLTRTRTIVRTITKNLFFKVSKRRDFDVGAGEESERSKKKVNVNVNVIDEMRV